MKGHFLISIITMAICQTSFAGWESHGGSGEYCFNSETGNFISLTLTDFSEVPNIKLAMGPWKLPYSKKIQIVVDRLQKLIPSFASQLSQELSQLKPEFVEGDQVKYVFDDIFFGNDPNIISCIDLHQCCQQRFIANFKYQTETGEYRLYILKHYWDLLDNNGKAGLLLHEALYRIHLRAGIKVSNYVRSLVALIASEEITKLSASEFETWLKERKFIR